MMAITRRIVTTLSVCAAACLVAPALRAQVPRDRVPVSTTAPAVPAASGSITGTVIADADGRTIAGASIVAIGTKTGALRVAASNASGQFSITGLADDAYVVGASRPPFLGAIAGARRAGRPGVPVVVSHGAATADVVVRLPAGAVIAGKLTEPNGRPAVRATVILYRRKADIGGSTFVQATTVAGGTTTTDDNGTFRVYGIPPGEYVVAGFSSGGAPRALTAQEYDDVVAGRPMPPPDTPPLPTVTFYPSVVRADDAAAITVGVGEERLGVDFQLQLQRAVKFSGSVTTDGAPLTSEVTVETTMGIPGASRMSVSTLAPGRQTFDVSNATPGSYRVIAATRLLDLVATAVVEVGPADTVAPPLVLRPPAVLSGRVVMNGAQPPSLASRTLPVRFGRAYSSFRVPQQPILNAAGEFRFTLLSERLLIGGQLPLGAGDDAVKWSLQSVIVDGRDMTDRVMDLDIANMPKDVIVTFTDQWQQLSGRIATATGAPVSDVSVLVVPKDRAYWYDGSRRVVSARPDADGRFTLGGRGYVSLPAGDYVLVTVDDLGRDEQYDPSFLATVVNAGIPFTLAAGERKVQDLVVQK